MSVDLEGLEPESEPESGSGLGYLSACRRPRCVAARDGSRVAGHVDGDPGR